MTEDIENGTTLVESDIEPILKSSSKEGQNTNQRIVFIQKMRSYWWNSGFSIKPFFYILWISYQEISSLCGHIIRQVPEL